MKGNFKKMFGKKFAKVMSIFLSCAIALSSFAPVAYATDGVETVSDQVSFNYTYDWQFTQDNLFTVPDKGTSQIGVTLSEAPAGYHYEFLVGSYDHSTEIIVPDAVQNGAVQAIPSDDSGTLYELIFDGQKLMEYENVQQNGYIYYATALVDDTTGEIESSHGFDVFVSVEEPEQTPAPTTHQLSHQIYMGSGNLCEVPSVGATANVKVGDVFAVRFFDNGEQLAVEKVTVSQEGLTAAGFEIANRCGCGHIDFRVTESAKLGAKILYFTVTFDDGTVMYPEVAVQVVEEGEGETTDGVIGMRWHLVGSGEVEYDFEQGMDAAVDVAGDTGFYITMTKGDTILIPTAFETGDTDRSGTDGIMLEYGHEGSAVFVGFGEGLTNGQKLVKITNDEGEYWFYFNVTGDQGSSLPEHVYATEEEARANYTDEFDGLIKFVVGPSSEPSTTVLENDVAWSQQGSMFGVEFWTDETTQFPFDSIGIHYASNDLGFKRNADASYGGIDVYVYENATPGYHVAMFEIGNQLQPLIVHVSEKANGGGVTEDVYFTFDMPTLNDGFTGEMYAVTGPSDNADRSLITDFFGSMQGSMLGIEFYEDGELVPVENIGFAGGSYDLPVTFAMDRETAYGYIDINVNENARVGFHRVDFLINGKLKSLVVHVSEAIDGPGSNPGQYEDTFTGEVLIAPQVNADGTVFESPIPWWNYNEMGDMSGNCFRMSSDNIFGVKFLDENGEVISPENVEMVTPDHSLMEIAGLPYDYKVFYLGDRWFIGEKELTFKINDQYKTIRVVSEYAVVTEWQNPVEDRVTHVVFDNYDGYFSREFTEEHGTVVVFLEGNNLLYCDTGSPVIKTAGNLAFAAGGGDLTINFAGAADRGIAIHAGGSLTVEGQFEDHMAITVNDIGRATQADSESVTEYHGADVVVGEGHSSVWCTEIAIDGDLIINNAAEEDWYEEFHVEYATVTAENITVNGGITSTFYSTVNAKTITAGKGVNAAIGGKFIISGEADDTVGISTEHISLVNGIISVSGGMPMYHENLGFMAPVYAADEIYIEHVPGLEGDHTEPSLSVTTDVEQAYAVAARNLSMIGGIIDINSEGSSSTAVYTFGNAESYDYGVVIHSGNVNIVSNGGGIWSDKDIQLGNADYGNAAFINVTANGGYAVAVDPQVGGSIVFENTGIRLYGSDGAVAPRYYPVSTDFGWWDFGHNEYIWVKAGESAEDATVVFDFEDINCCKYVETAEPDDDAKVTVSFETYGAMHAVKPVTKVTGNYYGVLPTPVKIGYIFAGWTTDPEGLDYLADGRVPGEDHTLYATWVEGEENTLYFDGFDSSHFEIPYSFFINYYEDALTVEFDGYNVINVPERAFNTAELTFNGAEGATMIINSDNHYNNVIYTAGKLTFNGNASYMIDGRIMSNNGIEFNNCEVEIYAQTSETALQSYAWGYNETGDIVVNKGAIVSVMSEGGTAVLADGANIIVNNGGALGAQGKVYGAQASKSTYGNGGKITVVKGGSLVAMGDKAAMKAETYSLTTAKKMVAGFNDYTAKAVKSYNNERFFSIGDYAEVGSEVITDMVVNGEWFDSTEEYQGKDFYYVPNTTFNGKEGQNVIYFDYFCFREYSDIEGIKSLIFSPVDVVLTSIPENQHGSVTDTEIDYIDSVYLIYSLGDVHISNFETGESYLNVRAENLTVDNDAYFKAENLDVNKDLTVNKADLAVDGILEVKGNAHFEGTNREYEDCVSIAPEFNWSGSEIHGDLEVLGAELETGNNLRVYGDVLVASGSITAKSYDEYSQAHIMVDGNFTVGNFAETDIDHLTATDVVVEEMGALGADRVSAANVTVYENGTLNTRVATGYSSLNVNSKLNVYGGNVKAIGGIETYELNITGGSIDVTDAANGIDLGKMNMSGGTINIGIDNLAELDWYDGYNVTTHGIILRSYGPASVMNITGGELNIRAGEYAIYLTKGRKATINTSAKKYEAKARLQGGRAAVYTGGTLTAYGDLTASYWYDGLDTVKSYTGESVLFVNVKSHNSVIFHKNNGEEDHVHRVRLDETTYDYYVEKEGFTFNGWYTDPECTVPYDFDTPVTEDIDLYAGWVSHKYTLHANGGKFVTDDAASDTFVVNVPYYDLFENQFIPTPSKANCIFNGWYTDAECTVPYEYGVAAAGDAELYADWTYKYTVSDVVATIVPGDAERTEMTVVYWPADDSEATKEHLNLGVRLGDRIVLKTATSGAEIWYALLNTEQKITDDSYKLYTGAIEITEDMLPESGVEDDNGELFDALCLFVYATKADYNESTKNKAIISVDTDRDEWGDVLEEDRAEFADALAVPDFMWVANVPAEVEYTGAAIKVDDMRVYDNKTLLELNKDYTVTYASNTNAGTAKITVRGKGNYADTLVKTFTITPMEIDGTAESGANFEAQLNAEVKTVTTGVQKPTVKFVKDGKALVNNKDYTVTFEMYDEATDSWSVVAGPKEVGKYHVVITGKGNYSGVVYADFRITANVLADKFTVSGVKAVNYTGEAVKQPDMVVKCSGKTLVEGVDYDAFYSNNVNVGKATIAIVARVGSGYEGVKFVTFDIKGTKLTANMLKGFAANVAYNGGEHKQDGMSLVNKGVTLTEGEHYTVAYENNTVSGTATMTVTGMGGYTGTVTKTFTIGTKLAATMLKEFKTYLKYFETVDENGYVEQPADRLEVKVKVDGVTTTVTLTEDVDYKVIYTNNDKAGTATVVYEGIGAYYGTFNKTFTIAATSFKAAEMKVENWTDTVVYTGEAIEQSGYDLYFGSKLLTEGVDYTVTYKNNLKAGTATATFKGMTGYSGTYNKTFKISKVTADNVVVDMPETAAYTKGGTTPEPVINYGDIVLKKGTDYTVTYKNQTKLGTAKATIKFKGNFEGLCEFSYEIVPADIENVTVTVADIVFKNTAGNYKAVPKLVDTNKKSLATNADFDKVFEYTYEEDVQLANGVVRHYGEEVGARDVVPAGTTLRVTVYGKVNYYGAVSETFRVVKTSVASAAVTIEAQNYTGRPVELDKNQITVKAGGVELGYGDYEIIGYENNTKIGTAKVTIKGVGTYGGTKTVTFKIQAKSAKTVIKFMANGGTGNVASVNVMNEDVTLTSIFNKAGKQTINRKDYVFNGWNTEMDGSGVHYDNEAVFAASDRGDARTIRLYAQWIPVDPA